MTTTAETSSLFSFVMTTNVMRFNADTCKSCHSQQSHLILPSQTNRSKGHHMFLDCDAGINFSLRIECKTISHWWSFYFYKVLYSPHILDYIHCAQHQSVALNLYSLPSVWLKPVAMPIIHYPSMFESTAHTRQAIPIRHVLGNCSLLASLFMKRCKVREGK